MIAPNRLYMKHYTLFDYYGIGEKNMLDMNLNTISYDTGNLESQGHEYIDLGTNLKKLLETLDTIMDDSVKKAIAGDAGRQLANDYILAREAMEGYPDKINGVGNSLIAAAQSGKNADNSLVGDVDINII